MPFCVLMAFPARLVIATECLSEVAPGDRVHMES